MKKLNIFYILVALFLMIPRVSAASSSVSVYTSRTSMIVGQTVYVTVTVSSSSNLGAWEFDLKYDTSKLTLVSSPTGGARIVDYVSNSTTKKKSYNFSFKAKARGTANISVINSRVIDFNENNLSVSNGSRNVSIITLAEYEASLSKNNYLGSLGVEGGELSPEFDKTVTEYSVTLEPETKKATITGTKDDSKSLITGLGEVELDDGSNAFDIKVEAQNGSVRTYKLNIIVEELNPITVTVDKKELTIVRKSSLVECPTTFEKQTTKIGDEDVPNCYNEKVKYSLLLLKDSEGLTEYYINDNSKFTKYTELSFSNFSFTPTTLVIENQNEDLEKSSVKINDNKIETYKLVNRPDFHITQGLNLETGESGYYLYDSKDKTIQRFAFDEMLEEEKLEMSTVYLLAGIGGFSLVVTILLILLIVKMNNQKKKIRILKEKYNF